MAPLVQAWVELHPRADLGPWDVALQNLVPCVNVQTAGTAGDMEALSNRHRMIAPSPSPCSLQDIPKSLLRCTVDLSKLKLALFRMPACSLPLQQKS